MSIMARFASQVAAISPEVDLKGFSAQVDATLARIRSGDTSAVSGFWPPDGHWMSRYRPYVVVDGVLQIPIKGVLLNDYPYADEWATGYEYVREAIARGVDDGSVDTIALVVNSGGGMVTGCFETADAIFAARGVKRIVAYVNDHAYSAAYALASSAHEVVCTRTAGVGSIGVVTYHVDLSGAYEQFGIKLTYIFAGKHKVDGNETEPLPADVRKRIEHRLAASYDVFVGTVARNRGLKEQDVRATEALTYTALDAIEVGLADRIGAYSDAISAIPAATTETEDDEMSITQEDLDAAVAAARAEEKATATAAATAAADTARTEATTAERGRILAILSSDAAKERPAAAHQAAFTLALDAETAATFLGGMPAEKSAAAPKPEEAAAPAGMFQKAMDADGPTGLAARVDTEEATNPRANPNEYFASLAKR